MQEHSFEIIVDDVPYFVKVEPFTFNTETRFKVSYNGGTAHVFTWDSDIKRLRPIDDAAATMPDALERAIAARLEDGRF